MHPALIRARHLPSPRPPLLPSPCPDRRRPHTPLLALPSSSAETRPCWFTGPFGMRWRSCRSLCEQRSTRRPRSFCRVRAGQSRPPSRSLASCSDTPSMCLLSSQQALRIFIQLLRAQVACASRRVGARVILHVLEHSPRQENHEPATSKGHVERGQASVRCVRDRGREDRN